MVSNCSKDETDAPIEIYALVEIVASAIVHLSAGDGLLPGLIVTIRSDERRVATAGCRRSQEQRGS